MRPFLFVFAALLASPAFAHPGHIADVAGHNHWIAGVAIGAAIAAAIWGHLKGKKAEEDASTNEEDTPEEQSA